MSGERRYPLSEWGAQRLRRRGITPSTAACYRVVWSIALLLSLYGCGATVIAFAETFVDLATGDGLELGCSPTAAFRCTLSTAPDVTPMVPAWTGLQIIGGVAGGIAALALLLRVLGVRSEQPPTTGWREASFAGLLVTAAGAAIFAIGVWLALGATRIGTLSHGEPSDTLVELARDSWPMLIIAITLLGGVVAAIHGWVTRLDFRDRWRMTERERRDELRDTQMSPEVRRAISRQSDQR